MPNTDDLCRNHLSGDEKLTATMKQKLSLFY